MRGVNGELWLRVVVVVWGELVSIETVFPHFIFHIAMWILDEGILN